MAIVERERSQATNYAPQRRVRVAHVALTLDLGGAEQLLVEFAKHCDKQRFELNFVALANDGVIGEKLRGVSAKITVLNAREGLRPGLVFRLARCFREQGVDIVHTHLDRPHIYGTLAARLAGIRHVIHTRHGQADNLTSRQHRLVRAVSRWTKRFVCVSQDAAKLTTLSHGISSDRISTIWNGIDLSRFSAMDRDPLGPVVTVARLMPEKDLETWLRAAALAAQQDDRLRFEIAGDGPCRGRLESLAHELGIKHRVRFIGAIDDVPAFLSRAGIFMLSSRTEGISLAVLEAQARGLPVIATEVGGNVEIITHERNGLLVPSLDPNALAEAILRLRRDLSLNDRIGIAGRRRMEDQFDVVTMVQRYESLYDSMLDESRLAVPS